MASNDILIKLKADFGNLEKELNNVTKKLDKLEKDTKGGFDGIANSLKGFGGMIATAFSVDAIKEFGQTALNTASDLSALNSQYEQVMGGLKDTTDKYLTEVSKRYNVHPNELKGAMVQYQALLKGKGVSEKEAFELSKQYLERTVDAAAFNNGTMAENTERFMAMIKGEYDSVDTAMVNLSATMLNDTAIKEYGKKFDDLSVAQQEQLKTSIALKQHTSSGVLDQGVREAESYQVVSQRLKATFEELLAKFGSPIIEALAPKLQDLANSLDTEKVKEMAEGFGDFVVKIMEAVPSVLELASAWSPLLIGLASGLAVFKALSIISAVVGFIKGMITAVKTASSVWALLNGVMIANPFGVVAVAIGVLVAGGVALYKNWDKVKEMASKLGEKLGQVWDGICEGFDGFVQWVSDGFNSFISNVSGFMSSVGDAFSNGWNAVIEWTSNAWETLKNLVTVGIMFLGEIIKLGFNIITLPWQFIWQNCKDFLIPIFEGIKSFISTAIQFIGNTIKTIVTNIVTFWTNAFNKVRDVVHTVFYAIKDFLTPFATSFANFILSWLNTILTFWTNVFNKIRSVVSTVFNAIRSVISSILSAIRSVISSILSAIVGFFTTQFNKAKAIVTTVFNAIRSVISSVLNTAKSIVSSILSGIYNTFSSKLQSISNKVKSVFENVKNTMSNMMNSAKNLVSGAFDKIKNIFNTVLKPNIKMPHLKISGKFSLNPPSVPKFGIEWYQTGGIFTGASVIGVGENGDEAVVPLSNKRRMKPFASAVASMIGADNKSSEGSGNGGVTINVSQMVVREESDIKKIAEELNRLQKRENRLKGI